MGVTRIEVGKVEHAEGFVENTDGAGSSVFFAVISVGVMEPLRDAVDENDGDEVRGWSIVLQCDMQNFFAYRVWLGMHSVL